MAKQVSIGVLISGSGTNLQSIIDAVEAKKLDAKIQLVLSNRADAYGLVRAQNHGIPIEVLEHTSFPSREVYDQTVVDLLRAAQSHYETAASLNAGEELFRKGYTSLLSSGTIGSPLTRAKDSVARYDAWSATGSAVRVASAKPVAAPPSTPTSTPTSPAKPSAAGMRNQTVIDLAKAGLSDENIILAIDAAAQTSFDLSPEGLIALSKGGVSKTVIAHMQKQARR